MADINSIVVYDAEMRTLIAQKLASGQFLHSNWGDDELLAIRSHIRNYYRTEQSGKCAYCRNTVSLTSATNCHVEHIAPKSKYRNFMFEPKNLCVVCAECNEIKHNQEVLDEVPDTVVNGAQRVRYPRATTSFKIIHPHFDVYDDHIQIFNGYYLDKSAKGHFTIGACKLNRKLHEFGWAPELCNEHQLSEAMNRFLDSTDAVGKTSALNALAGLLFNL